MGRSGAGSIKHIFVGGTVRPSPTPVVTCEVTGGALFEHCIST